MKIIFLTTLASVLLGVLATPFPTPGLIEKRATTLCGNWGTLSTGGYTIYHNNWGVGSGISGSQCTTFDSLRSSGSLSWSTSWTWAGGQGQVKSYSNVALEHVNKKLSAVKSIDSTWKWSYTGTNIIADVAYDLWLAPSVGTYGGAGPISSTGNSPIASPTIAGTKWRLFKGPNGDTTVFSFIAPSNLSTFTADLNLFFKYLTTSQKVPSGYVITSFQAGTEPFSGSKAMFTTSKYTIKVL